MKFLILLLISFSAFANYIPKAKVGTDLAKTVFTNQKKCSEHYGEICIKIPSGYNTVYHYVKPDTQLKLQGESCLDEEDCQTKLESLFCEKGKAIKNLDLLEVYCTYLELEHVAIDTAKKQAHEAQKAQKEAMKSAMDQARKAMDCGKNVKARLIVQNAGKNLSKGQIKTLVKNFSDIDALLESGSLATAQEEIMAAAVDGVLITEEDKTALIAEIGKCL